VNKFHTLLSVILIIFIGCSEDETVNQSNTGGSTGYKSVRYFAFVTPVDNAQVTKTFAYTNEYGGTTQKTTGNGTFEKELQIKSGTYIQLDASGRTTTNLVISCRAIIYIDGVNVAESNASSQPLENSVSVSVIVP
jgi:hypothetical protein